MNDFSPEELAAAQALMPAVKTSPYSSPMHNFPGSIMLLTNPENELFKLELTLRNCIIDKDGNPKSIGAPLLNEVGVTSIIGQTQAIVSQVTVMSNLEEDEIIALMGFLGDTLAKDLMVNRVRYGVNDMASRDKIYFLVLSSSFITMKRAANEGERRFWKGSQQEITTRIEGMNTKRKGGLAGMLGWGGK